MMKFTYDKTKAKEPVAFILRGELYLKSLYDKNLVLPLSGLPYPGDLTWKELLEGYTPDKVFYEGDSITITF